MASLVLSIIGAIFGLIGLVPLLGFVNWIAIFILVIALILRFIGLNKSGKANAGMLISIIFLIIAILRLFLGGGIL